MKTIKRKDLQFLILFVVVVSCSFIYLFQSSYAKYRRAVSGEVSGDIAQWNITVNNEDISNKKTLSTVISATFPESEYNKEGVIAPGVEGYYTINLDASQVDVPFECNIFSDVSPDSSVSDLKTLSYEVNPTTSENKIDYSSDTGIVRQIQRNTKQTIFKIYLKWDDETGTMDNQTDTSVGVDSNSKALMKVTLHFSQINQ